MNKKTIYAVAAAAILLVVVFIFVRSLGSPEKPGFVLQLQPETVNNQSRLALRFINEGPGDLILATGELHTSLIKSDKDPNLFCILMGKTQEEFNGARRVVISPYDLRPVELRRNEEIRLNDLTPLLSNLPAGQIKLVTAYEVSESIGKRYGVWYGYLESNAIELTVNRTAPAAQ